MNRLARPGCRVSPAPAGEQRSSLSFGIILHLHINSLGLYGLRVWLPAVHSHGSRSGQLHRGRGKSSGTMWQEILWYVRPLIWTGNAIIMQFLLHSTDAQTDDWGTPKNQFMWPVKTAKSETILMELFQVKRRSASTSDSSCSRRITRKPRLITPITATLQLLHSKGSPSQHEAWLQTARLDLWAPVASLDF